MKTAPNFDRIARIYQRSEYLTLGPLLERTREHFRPRLMDQRKAVVFGDGDGRFLEKLLEASPSIQAFAIDLSGEMLNLLRRRCAFAGARLETLQASALDASLSFETDLVVTHFFLDCLTQAEVDDLTQRLGEALAPGSLWVMSDFAVPQNWLLRFPAWLYIRSLYFAFRVLTGLRVTQLPDAGGALERAGFRRVERHQKLFGVLYTELWERQ
jgi:ubiquinone/menaquinone biosynthesis C-methylase UbiE